MIKRLCFNEFSTLSAVKIAVSDNRMTMYGISSLSELDKISCDNELVRKIPAGRLPVTLLLVTMFRSNQRNAILYHCEVDNQRRTFIKGRWDDLGLGLYSL